MLQVSAFRCFLDCEKIWKTQAEQASLTAEDQKGEGYAENEFQNSA